MKKIICLTAALLMVTACATKMEKVPPCTGSLVRGYHPVVYFGFNQSNLTQNEQKNLENWTVEKLKRWPSKHVVIAGYTDTKGSQDYNMKLSQRRANSVKNFLVKKGISADRITVEYYGKTHLITEDASHQDLNRRVEMYLFFPRRWGVL